jgi:hypothetical protein
MTDLTEAELAELQDPESWDWESAERHPPNLNAGAVVRVRLTGQDFRAIAQAARAADMTLADFVRDAAISRATAGRTAGKKLTKPSKPAREL